MVANDTLQVIPVGAWLELIPPFLPMAVIGIAGVKLTHSWKNTEAQVSIHGCSHRRNSE
jgi:hypothetical protein